MCLISLQKMWSFLSNILKEDFENVNFLIRQKQQIVKFHGSVPLFNCKAKQRQWHNYLKSDFRPLNRNLLLGMADPNPFNLHQSRPYSV